MPRHTGGRKHGGFTVFGPVLSPDAIAALRVPPQDDQCRERAWADHLARQASGDYDYARYCRAKFGKKGAIQRAVGEEND